MNYPYMYSPYPEYPQITRPVANPQNNQINTVPQISGKFINDIKDVTANDVPMTGQPAVFIKNDLSEIYTKAWGSDGTIATAVYKKFNVDTPKDMKISEIYNELTDRMDDMEAKISGRFEKIERVVKTNIKPKREEVLE